MYYYFSNIKVLIGNTNKCFTYDFAYDGETEQAVVYQEAVRPIIEKLFIGDLFCCCSHESTVKCSSYLDARMPSHYLRHGSYICSASDPDPLRSVVFGWIQIHSRKKSLFCLILTFEWYTEKNSEKQLGIISI